MREHNVVDEHSGKRLVAEGLQQPAHPGVRYEGLRFLTEANPAHLHPLRSQPAQVARELQEGRVDARAANAGRAAHGRIEDCHSSGQRDGLDVRRRVSRWDGGGNGVGERECARHGIRGWRMRGVINEIDTSLPLTI